MDINIVFHRVSSLKDVNNKTDQLLEQVNLASKSDLEASLLTYAEQRALEIELQFQDPYYFTMNLLLE